MTMGSVGPGRGTLYLVGSFVLALLVLCAGAGADAARAERLVVEVGKGLQLRGTEETESLFVADSDIADLSASPGEAQFVYGKKPGETTVIGVDVAGKTLFRYDVIVIHNLDEMRRMLSQRFQGARISIQSARGSVYARGIVPDERTYDAVIASLRSNIPDSVLIEEIAVAESPTIKLDVTFMEVSREQLETYGINWSVLVSSRDGDTSVNVGAWVKLLVDNGVGTVLSETTLTTVSRRKASFMVGEEVAVPGYAADNDLGRMNYGVEYKFVGLTVDFTPELLAGGEVSLEIASEVSSLGDKSRFISGNRVPNVASRKLETSVELSSGQSYILAGLSRLDTTASGSKPRDQWGVAGEVVRSLLGHDDIRSRQRDLIVVVTPHFGESQRPDVAEVVDLQQTNLEYILSVEGRKRRGHAVPVDLHGSPGFLY